ncbi:MAG: MOSC domain-containing protein [Gaiella sp.]
MSQVTPAELDAGLGHVEDAPREEGVVELVVRRPDENEREVLDEGVLDPTVGLVGDAWSRRPTATGPDGGPDPNAQLTLMNARLAELVAGDRDKWPLAGDQLYVDLDLSVDNLPPGSRLQVGTAVVEITAEPHMGCAKFSARFGSDALRFINSPTGRALRLRGVNARVVDHGSVRPGDAIRKL